MPSVGTTPYGVNHLADDENMPMILMALQGAEEIGIDTETTGLNVRNGIDYLISICVSVPGLNAYIPIRHEVDNIDRRWWSHINEILCEKDLIWHNQKFDFHSFKTMGFDPLNFRGKQYDTMMIAHLNNEEEFSKELDFLAKKYLKEGKEESDAVHGYGKIYGYAKIPPKAFAPYGCKDAEITRRLKDELWPRLVKQGLESLYWDSESPLTALLYKMEQRGVGTNQQFASDMAERGHARMATIRRELGWNPASTIDLGRYLLDELGLPVLARTPKGKPSFNKHAMEEYDEILQASNDPTAARVAEYRGWQKATSSLYVPVTEKVGPDGRLRTQFKQHGTVTGRLSAADPNLQQVPRGSQKVWNGNAKSCFTSGKEGFLLYGWDYSQIELRLAAAYGREQILLTEFDKEKSDPFHPLCVLIFGEFSEEGRHDTKTFVYANLYGAGLEKIAAQLGRTVAETRPLFENYKRGIPGITQVSKDVSDLIKRQGYVSYWNGRRRHMRDKNDSYKAWNSLIQGGAAEIVKKAMLRCEEFADDDCYPVLTVHDEITFVVREEALPDYEKKIINAMTDFPDWPVKFAVEGKEWK